MGPLTVQFPNGLVTQLYGVFVYRVNDAGKVTALRTYWEETDLQIYPPFEERRTSAPTGG